VGARITAPGGTRTADTSLSVAAAVGASGDWGGSEGDHTGISMKEGSLRSGCQANVVGLIAITPMSNFCISHAL